MLDEAGVANAIVIGHSWGGYLAAQLVAAHRSRVVALVSIDGVGLVGDGGWPAFDRHFEDALPAPAAARVAEIDRRRLPGWKENVLRSKNIAEPQGRDRGLSNQIVIGVIKNLLPVRGNDWPSDKLQSVNAGLA